MKTFTLEIFSSKNTAMIERIILSSFKNAKERARRWSEGSKFPVIVRNANQSWMKFENGKETAWSTY